MRGRAFVAAGLALVLLGWLAPPGRAEDDFARVEWNYVVALGRTAEADGEKAIWADLRQKLVTDPADLQRKYAASPAWLRALMDSWAEPPIMEGPKRMEPRERVLPRGSPFFIRAASLALASLAILLNEVSSLSLGARIAALASIPHPRNARSLVASAARRVAGPQPRSSMDGIVRSRAISSTT